MAPEKRPPNPYPLSFHPFLSHLSSQTYKGQEGLAGTMTGRGVHKAPRGACLAGHGPPLLGGGSWAEEGVLCVCGHPHTVSAGLEVGTVCVSPRAAGVRCPEQGWGGGL